MKRTKATIVQLWRRSFTCPRCQRFRVLSHLSHYSKFGQWPCSCAGCGMRYTCLCHAAWGLNDELLQPWRRALGDATNNL